MGTFFIIATPIGNLEDITLRALRILKEADLVLCEDTRVTRKLLDHYGIAAPTESYNAHASEAKHERVIGMLREGKNVALVSDAGTPAISDPGSLLVKRIRDELGDEAVVVPIPGASAVLSVLSASGFPSSDFLFLGFLPHKKGRETLFQEIAAAGRTVVFYESPHRIMKTLESLALHLGPERRLCVGREITKMFEDIRVMPTGEMLAFYRSNPDKIRGEFTIAVCAYRHKQEAV